MSKGSSHARARGTRERERLLRPAGKALTALPPDTAAAIEAIAAEVRRLIPSWERPEAFHERKAEILAALRALARGPLLVRRIVRVLPAAVPASSQRRPERARTPRGGPSRLPLARAGTAIRSRATRSPARGSYSPSITTQRAGKEASHE